MDVGAGQALRDALRARQSHSWSDNPFRSKWQPLLTGTTANVVSFSPTGAYLALGTTLGEVLVWELASMRTLVRTFTVPAGFRAGGGGGGGGGGGEPSPAPAAPAAPARADDERGGVCALAWSADGVRLFAGTTSCALLVWDVVAGSLLRATALGAQLGSSENPPRFLRPLPLRGGGGDGDGGGVSTTLLLVVPWSGAPLLLDWGAPPLAGGGAPAWALSEALLPPPKKRAVRATLTRVAAAAAAAVAAAEGAPAPAAVASTLRCDAVWGAAGGGGAELYLLSGRGDLCWLRLALPPPPGAGGGAPEALAVTRLAYAATPPPLSAPELHFLEGVAPAAGGTGPFAARRGGGGGGGAAAGGGGSGGGGSGALTAHDFLLPSLPACLLATTRAGVCLFDPFSLAPLPGERYCEPVDNTQLVSVAAGARGRVLYTLPHEHCAGHMAGGVYAFNRGRVGEVLLKRAPAESGGITRLDVHPTAGLVVGIGSRGAAFFLQEPVISSWAGPMYPPGERLRRPQPPPRPSPPPPRARPESPRPPPPAPRRTRRLQPHHRQCGVRGGRGRARPG
jgi:hypothetical protein